MDRIDNATVSLTLPAPAAASTPGYFRKKTPTQSGTIISADWLNSIQEEICYTIETAGFTLDKNDNTQLYDAIVAIAESVTIETATIIENLDVQNFSIMTSIENGSVNIEGAFTVNNTVEIDAIVDNFDTPNDTSLPTQFAILTYLQLVTLPATPIRQVFSGFNEEAIAASSTRYISQGDGLATTGTAAADKANSFFIPNAGTLSNLAVALDQSGANYTFTVFKNGVATALTCAGGTFQEDTTHTVAVLEGDFIQLQVVTDGAATTLNRITWSAVLEP